MTSNCSTAELVSLSGSVLDTPTLQAIIDQADRDIGSHLAVAGVGTSTSDDNLKAASLKLSMAGLIRRAELDGSKIIGKIRIGDITTSDDPREAVSQLTESAMTNIQAYIMTHGANRRSRFYLRKVNP